MANKFGFTIFLYLFYNVIMKVGTVLQKTRETLGKYRDIESPFSRDIEHQFSDNYYRILRSAERMQGIRNVDPLDQDMEKVSLWLAGKSAKAARWASFWKTADKICCCAATAAMVFPLTDILTSHSLGLPNELSFIGSAVAVGSLALRYFFISGKAAMSEEKRVDSCKDLLAASTWEKFTEENPPKIA